MNIQSQFLILTAFLLTTACGEESSGGDPVHIGQSDPGTQTQTGSAETEGSGDKAVDPDEETPLVDIGSEPSFHLVTQASEGLNLDSYLALKDRPCLQEAIGQVRYVSTPENSRPPLICTVATANYGTVVRLQDIKAPRWEPMTFGVSDTTEMKWLGFYMTKHTDGHGYEILKFMLGHEVTSSSGSSTSENLVRVSHYIAKSTPSPNGKTSIEYHPRVDDPKIVTDDGGLKAVSSTNFGQIDASFHYNGSTLTAKRPGDTVVEIPLVPIIYKKPAP